MPLVCSQQCLASGDCGGVNTTRVTLPLGLPVEEAKRGIEEPAHLRQQPLLIDGDEDKRRRRALEGDVDHLSESRGGERRQRLKYGSYG